MSRRASKGGRTQPQPWEPFTERQVPDATRTALAKEGLDTNHLRVFRNNRYQVTVTGVQLPLGTMGIADGRVLHLSIKRLDKGPIIRDWRNMQRIKNELVGPECEGIELYPAESRLLDEANQYHMWVVPDPAFRFAVGGHTRWVDDSTSNDARPGTPRQRPFVGKVVRSAAIDACPLRSLLPSHYNDDGTCQCTAVAS